MTTYNKHHAKRTQVDGIWFHSKLEAARYQELKLLEHAGLITRLKLQPVFELQPKFTDNTGKTHQPIKYIADFEYWDVERELLILEDTKGQKTYDFTIKEKLFRFKYPDRILNLLY